jgi:hypothetical protein
VARVFKSIFGCKYQGKYRSVQGIETIRESFINKKFVRHFMLKLPSRFLNVEVQMTGSNRLIEARAKSYLRNKYSLRSVIFDLRVELL